MLSQRQSKRERDAISCMPQDQSPFEIIKETMFTATNFQRSKIEVQEKQRTDPEIQKIVSCMNMKSTTDTMDKAEIIK